MFSRLATTLLLALTFFSPVYGSSGDQLPEFQECVSQCIGNSCPRDLGLLKFLAWDCPSDCDYLCQQALTNEHERLHHRVHQYHGKWPFVRVMGIQELASVAFSLLNLLPHYLGYKTMRKQNNSSDFHMKNYYVVFGLVGINTWIWSSVFHVRDLPVTEKLDYFSAIGQILYGLFVSVVRLFRLDIPAKRTKRNALICALGGFYACHVYYLSCVKFNYAYNMLAGVVIGLSQTALWVYLGLKLFVRGGDKMDLLPVAIVLSVIMGMSFELNDFSPYWHILDAHAMWHASTVIPTFLWYRWMRHDMHRHAKDAWNRKENPQRSF